VTIRVVIVDDEELARRGIRARLERAGDVEILAECEGGSDAIAAIGRTSPDLVFLDVQMPGTSGLDVVEAIGPAALPRVIFVTAYDSYAIRAFEVNALDYLLKPIDDDRFDAALGRARESLARDGDLERRLAALLASVGGRSTFAERFAVRARGRVVLVAAADVDWVEATGDYVTLHVGAKTWMLRETLASIEAKLDPAAFARIHRSAVVNVDRIAEMRPHDNGEYVVVLRDGTELKLSRSYRGVLGRLAEGL
jgi:two-component system, LytTR family, response regulator